MANAPKPLADILESLAEQPYCFAIVSPTSIQYGTQPQRILETWPDVTEWYSQARSHNTPEQLVGYISYEQGYKFVNPKDSSVLHSHKTDPQLTMPPVYFGVFEDLQTVELSSTEFSLSETLTTEATVDEATYQKHFEQLQQHIRQGDIYQANLTYRLQADLTQTDISSWQLFCYLYSQQPTPYGVYIRTPEFCVLSVSPELFLKVEPHTVATAPMKGTRLRDTNPEADTTQRADLETNPKDQAELDMIIDIHRNDLARIAKPGTVEVQDRRRITQLPTVWQADAVITAKREPEYDVLKIIESNFPAGSITGAPKIRAMEILHELEQLPRHVYTGTMGVIRSNDTAELNVAIRTAVIQNKQLYYYTGGGIVFDSTVADEWAETKAKAAILTPHN